MAKRHKGKKVGKKAKLKKVHGAVHSFKKGKGKGKGKRMRKR